jgi:hypothetical protein
MIAFNNVLREFRPNPSASMDMGGDNFPADIVGGFHVHVATSCDGDVGPHYFRAGWSNEGRNQDGDPFFADNTPIAAGGAVYTTDSSGVAQGRFNFANGYNAEQTVGRVVVLHDQLTALGGDYATIACGVLRYTDCPARRELSEWPKGTYLNYGDRSARDSLWGTPSTDSWSTSKAGKAASGDWDSWGTSKAGKSGGSKGGKASCVEWEGGSEGSWGGWGWQPAKPTPKPTWSKPPRPPCTNDNRFDCSVFNTDREKCFDQICSMPGGPEICMPANVA